VTHRPGCVHYLNVFAPAALGLVLLSFALGPAPMPLVFNAYELVALILAALITTTLIADGETTWFEGVQLLGVYGLLGVAFYYA